MKLNLFHSCCVAALLATCGSARAVDPTFEGVGGLWIDAGGRTQSHVSAISADGLVVVGTSNDETSRVRPFRWTQLTGMSALLDPASTEPAPFNEIGGVSADGSVVCGTVWPQTDCSTVARWTSGAPAELLSRGECVSAGFGVSADGQVVVGDLYTLSAELPFLWRQTTPTFVTLGPPEGYTDATARAVFGDGALVAGAASGSRGTQAIVWENRAPVPRLLGYLANTERYKIGRASAISDDGAFIVGYSSSTAAGSEGLEGFRYTLPAGPMMPLGVPAGNLNTSPMAVSRSGRVIVGSLYERTPPFNQTAFIWTADSGIRDLKTVLQSDYGFDLSAWTLSDAVGISADGLVIVGNGIGPRGEEGWQANLRTQSEPCIADFNADGGVDGNDVAAFFLAWQAADNLADVNQDGGVDGGDVEGFFVVWERGGC